MQGANWHHLHHNAVAGCMQWYASLKSSGIKKYRISKKKTELGITEIKKGVHHIQMN